MEGGDMEKKSVRDSLIEDIASELEKDADSIDGDFIDRRIDELCALEGLSPPKLNGEALAAAARTVRARAAWRNRNTLTERERKRRFTRRAVRWAWAACCAVLVLFSANYVTTMVTGSCLPSKVGIKVCCGTQFCRCETAEAKEESPQK
jgi:hypothetical protein